jgi:predicted nucleic acid-binding protein
MATSPAINLSVTLDASFVIAFCAREAGRDQKVRAEIERYASLGYSFYAPGVIIGESLFVFCRKTTDGTLTPAEYAQAVACFEAFMRAVLPPPNGDSALIARTAQIRGTYTCLRTNDSIYIALAESLAASGSPDLLTFDPDMDKQAKATAPTVNVRVFT